jgi:hypothetical protein
MLGDGQRIFMIFLNHYARDDRADGSVATAENAYERCSFQGRGKR